MLTVMKFNVWTVCHIQGVKYTGMASRLDMVQRGERLYIRRESYNKYDSNAVAICDVDGVRLGYVPKSLAAELAPTLDEGVPFIVQYYGRRNIRLRQHPGRAFEGCPTCVLPPFEGLYEELERRAIQGI